MDFARGTHKAPRPKLNYYETRQQENILPPRNGDTQLPQRVDNKTEDRSSRNPNSNHPRFCIIRIIPLRLMNHEQYLKEKAESQTDRKQEQWMKWIMGEDVEFPFFKDLPTVKPPKHYD